MIKIRIQYVAILTFAGGLTWCLYYGVVPAANKSDNIANQIHTYEEDDEAETHAVDRDNRPC